MFLNKICRTYLKYNADFNTFFRFSLGNKIISKTGLRLAYVTFLILFKCIKLAHPSVGRIFHGIWARIFLFYHIKLRGNSTHKPVFTKFLWTVVVEK